MQCANCGNDNPPEARFCARCGAALVEIASTSTPPTPTTSAPPAPSAQATQGVPAPAVVYAGFWIRFEAWFLDALVLIGMYVILAIGAAIVGGALGFRFLVFPLPWLYYWLFTGLKGQTPGKMVTGIMVVDEQGNVPDLGRAALRELLGKFISALALFIGFLWIAWDPRKQGWHDKLASTHVVRSSR